MLVADDKVRVKIDFKLTSKLYEILKSETRTQIETLTILGALLYFAGRRCGLSRADLMESILSVMDQVEAIDKSHPRLNVTPTPPN
jgi:hypothetical protein